MIPVLKGDIKDQLDLSSPGVLEGMVLLSIEYVRSDHCDLFKCLLQSGIFH